MNLDVKNDVENDEVGVDLDLPEDMSAREIEQKI